MLDEGSAGYLAIMADLLYNDALEADRDGFQEMCTANLEVVMHIQIAICQETTHDPED